MNMRRFGRSLVRGSFAAGACVAVSSGCTGGETGPIFTRPGTGGGASSAGATSGSGCE